MAALFKRLFNLEREEVVRGVLMFLYAFLLLSAYLILKPVRNSLFLDRFGADQLIYMYMLIAAAATPIAWLYGWTASRTTLPRLVGATTLIIVVNLIVIWCMIGQNVSWLIYAFYVWVSLFGVFTTSQFWLLANYVFDAREAKRVFPFIGAGAITGGITGSLLTQMLAELVGTVNLLWLCMVFMLLCFGLLLLVWKRRQGDDPKKTRHQKKSKDLSGMLPVIMKSRHLRLLTIMIGLTVIVSTFVDFQFNKVVKDAFDDKDKLTAFFGAFFFWLSVVSLILQLLLSSRILKRFGVGAAIMVLPFGLLLGSTAILLWPVLASAVAVKISDGAFRYSINKTGMELLYLPVPVNIKGRIKAFMDVVGDRFARGIGGGLLYLVNDIFSWPVQWISFLSAGLIAAWITTAALIRKEYSRQFKAALQGRTIDSEDIRSQLSDASSVNELIATIRGADRRQILFGLELVSQQTDIRLVEPLADLLGHPDREVRRRALTILSSLGAEGVLDRARPLLNDDDGDVRTEAVRFVCTVDGDTKPDAFRSLLTSSDPVLAASALRSALQHDLGDAARRAITPALVEEIMSSTKDGAAEARRQLAKALQYVDPSDELASVAPRLLADEDSKVRRFALVAVAQLKKTEFLPVIIGYLANPRLRGLASQALLWDGPELLGTLTDFLVDENQPLAVRVRIPKVMSRIESEEVAGILMTHLDQSSALLRYNVLKGLNRLRSRSRLEEVDKVRIKQLISAEARSYYVVSSYAAALRSEHSETPSENLLFKALGDRQNLHLEQAFRLTGLIYPIEDMYSAYQGIASSVRIVRSRAIEFLDTVWDREQKQHIFPILEQSENLSAAGERLFKLKQLTAEEALTELIDGTDEWLCACAINVVMSNKMTGFREVIESKTDSPYEALNETANLALAQLGS